MTKSKTKINFKYLAWSIIHLLLFVDVMFSDSTAKIEDGSLFFIIGLLFFFGWRFIENMKKIPGDAKWKKKLFTSV